MNTNLKIQDFLLEEYNNISEAHFKSIDTISNFFRYYLLLIGLPVPIIVVILQIYPNTNNFLYNINSINNYILISFILFCISFIGFAVCIYIINLRMDAILYARTINGIRKSFYENWSKPLYIKKLLEVLPVNINIPKYHEIHYFYPVVFSFALLNTIYFVAALLILIYNNPIFNIKYLSTCVIYFISHFLIYYYYSYIRENKYLNSNYIGIDIDGVLNLHRHTFCKFLEKNTNKKINPEKIKIIPVHNNKELNITKEDELAIFNNPKYWIEQIVAKDASSILKKISKNFNLKIILFTNRPWPNYKSRLKDFRNSLELINKIHKNPIKPITKKWLRENNLYYKLIIEKDNLSSQNNPFIAKQNRFSISRSKNINFFIEDDIENAIKLSNICEIVFLFSHPYNLPNKSLPKIINNYRKNLPENIIRVKDWRDLYNQIKKFT